ncbi:GNAT family N-acetyltransferase [Arthrobacter globiformis]|uniref:GNAT family N-acetyltransferase n=1 Tax=Arthrobacter globiformis TaxID=1665 RepID=UPI00358EF54E
MTSVELRWTTELTPIDYIGMAALFDSEYVDVWGPWTPKRGYGYARGELHALARSDGQLVGYAATARRFIGVGQTEVLIAGTGGVVTRQDSRGTGIGGEVLSALQDAAASFAQLIMAFSAAARKSCPSMRPVGTPAFSCRSSIFLPWMP